MASSISQYSKKYILFLLLTFCIFYFFQIWGRIRSLCLSVSLSCQLPSSSSHCVVSTSEKRGTKKKSLPLLSQNLSKLLPITVFLHTPTFSFRLSSCQAPSSSGHVELLSPYQPNHIVVASVSRTLRIVWATPRASRWLSLWETPGSSSSLAALRMCSGVCVPRFLTSRTI